MYRENEIVLVMHGASFGATDWWKRLLKVDPSLSSICGLFVNLDSPCWQARWPRGEDGKPVVPGLLVVDMESLPRLGRNRMDDIALRAPGVPMILLMTSERAEIPECGNPIHICDLKIDGPGAAMISMAIRRVLQAQATRRENERLRNEVLHGAREGILVGSSPEIRRLSELARCLSRRQDRVALLGGSQAERDALLQVILQDSGRGAEKDAPLIRYAISRSVGGATGRKELPELREAMARARDGVLLIEEEEPLDPGALRRLLLLLRKENGRHSARLIWSSPRSPGCAASPERRCGRCLFGEVGMVVLAIPDFRSRQKDLPRLIEAFARKHSPDGDAALFFAKVPKQAIRTLLDYPWKSSEQLERAVERLARRIPDDLDSRVGQRG